MSKIIPIFYDHSSGRSILRFSDRKKDQGQENNIINIAKNLDLKKIYFVSDTFHTFIDAYKLCKKEGIQIIFGLEILLCSDINVKNEESLKTQHKVIVFCKNSDAYKDIIKLYSSYKTNPDSKYYVQRCDTSILKKYWTSNLLLALPFFSSFLAKNTLNYGSAIIPDFPDKPVILKELESNHIHSPLINLSIESFNKNKNYEEVNTKTIYYNRKKDMKAWFVFRSIYEKSTFSNPELNFCCSDDFCVESLETILKK